MQDPTYLEPSTDRSDLSVDVLALIADSVICTGDDGRILIFNRAAEETFGYSAAEVVGRPVEILLPQRHREDHVRSVRDFGLDRGASHRLMGHRREVIGQRKNGEEFPVEAMVSRQSVDGRTILTVVLRDITERKEFEELREAAARELDHRMRNLLSVVNSLISLSAASAESVADFKESVTGRLLALSATQGALSGQQRSSGLREIVLGELGQYRTRDGANMAVDIPHVQMDPRAAQLLALVVHELATNSAKYGALGSVGGRVSVTATLNGHGDQGTLDIEWRESGGPAVDPPKRKGFGTRLIQQVIARALRADVTMEYRREGLVCRMTLPQAQLEAD